ncbi:flavodoxin family protein [Chromobacterium alticapitis]|uniref:Flavoprotein WrbA n=1 Tax=Chromobacterium alticapitis TaxID=2073169 RepID=A0A2S5DFC7_9NEIS|nr:flavodoxin family protein [Chromobacterium alticapitis]POZ61805.1 flavodoxin [Chromobacterium alticapitis]
MSKVLILYFSGSGTTHQLAEAIHEGAIEHSSAKLLRIQPEQLAEGRFALSAILPDLLDADAILFGSPTYMGAPAAQFKAFADASSELWWDQALADKIAAGFTVGGNLNGDQQATLNYFAMLASQHGMLWCGLDVAANHGPERLNRFGCQWGVCACNAGGELHPSDLATARHLGRRVARLAGALFARERAEAAAAV